MDVLTEWKALESELLVRREHIRTGAEARVFRGTSLGLDVVIKERYPRTYRVPERDDERRKKRIRGEARTLVEARNAGVNTPHILDLDLVRCTLILEYLPYPSLKDVLSAGEGENDLSPFVHEAGRCTGLLHAHDLIHGDLTTSNILMDEEGSDAGNGPLWFIDFGLAEKTDEIENKGVDLHVFTEAFESTHSVLMELLDDFYSGYLEGNPNGGEAVIARAGEIAKRGRYS